LTPLRAPLREREFRLLFAGRTISMAGSAMAPVALTFAVLGPLHGTATDVGLVLAARTVPVIALLLVGGVISDRLPRHRVMVGSNLLSCAAQAASAALLLSGGATLWNIAALAVVNSSSSAFFFPASAGIVPQTVQAPLLQRANSTLRLALNTTNIAGAAAGGLLVAGAGPGWAIGLDAASYAVAALVIGRMRISAFERDEATSMAHELRVGWHDFWSRTWLWTIVLQFSLVLAVENGALDVLGAKVSKTHYGGAGWFGGILAAAVGGNLATGLVMLRWQPQRMLRVATLAVFPLVLPLIAFSWPAPVLVVVAASFVAGSGIEVFGVLWDTAMQQEIPTERLSRLSAYDAFGSISLTPVGLAAAGPVAALVGLRAAFLGGAGVIVLATLLVLLSQEVRQLSRRMLPPEI
jgi:predicted MFS family arabinose efflux permease